MFQRIYKCCIWSITVICILAGLHIHTGRGRTSRMLREQLTRDKVSRVWDLEDDGDVPEESERHTEDGASGENSGKFHQIEVNTDVLDVRIVTGEKYQVSYECDEKLKPELSVSSDTLRLTQKGGKNNINLFPVIGDDSKNRVTVTVPEGTKLKRIKLDSDLGDISLQKLEVEKLTADLDTADIDLESCQIGSADIKSDTGDLEMEKSSFSDMACRSDTGDIEIKFTGNLSDYYMELETDAGDIEVNGKDRGTKVTEGRETSQHKLSVETDTGDIEIKG